MEQQCTFTCEMKNNLIFFCEVFSKSSVGSSLNLTATTSVGMLGIFGRYNLMRL
jgi:hypothetical protein